ncbi:vitellogenin-1-like [Musca autumnalis]|uniref:vitellogenin-1-like n=1 Tax=Musca autumnalis TaxID=221902 RepID=UPI003CED3651
MAYSRYKFLIVILLASDLADSLDTLLELTSNTIDVACRAVKNTVESYPINPPYIEKVSFQLRTACGTIEFPVQHVDKLRKFRQFDIRKKTAFFVAGWIAPPDYYYMKDIIKAYNCRRDYNFVLVNTGGFITNLYANSAYHTDKLGKFLAIGLRNLGLRVDNMHLIGHSLGAHIVGSAGRYYRQLTGRRLKRITGLDPARPCFVTPSVFPRLKRGDAEYIDIIHSNPFQFGSEELIGDVDFFPGGFVPSKPGCAISIRCSHEISVQYFAESVYPENERNFIGSQCRNLEELKAKSCSGPKSIMGLANAGVSRGIHYVPVRPIPPFGAYANVAATIRSYQCGLCRK